MPSEAKSESKDDESKDAKDEAKPLRGRRLSTGQIVSPLVVEFCEYATEVAFEGEVTEFIEANCKDFVGVELGDEQPLSWTQLHRDFLEIVERRLEAFCKEHDTSAEAVFKLIAETTADPSIEDEILPGILLNVEYRYFFENMKKTAEAGQIKRAALEAGDRAAPDNLSGVYQGVKEKTDPAALAEFLRASKVPWAFRKIFENAANTISDVCIVHTPDELVFNYRLNFFGTRSAKLPLDGKEHAIDDLLKRPIKTTGEMRGNQAVIRRSGQRSMPPGSYSVQTFHLERVDGEELLVWTQTKHPAGDAPFSMTYYFRRQE